MWAFDHILGNSVIQQASATGRSLFQRSPTARARVCVCVNVCDQVQQEVIQPKAYMLQRIQCHFLAFSGLQRRPEKARKCRAAQGPHSEVVPRDFWILVSKSCDECKGSFARGCEAKRWSHWTCSSLGTILQPMRINSVPDVKCLCNNKNVLRAQSMVWHFVRHPVYWIRLTLTSWALSGC